jgi:hypothetical protein
VHAGSPPRLSKRERGHGACNRCTLFGGRFTGGGVILQWNYFGFSNPAARLEKAEGKLNLN